MTLDNSASPNAPHRLGEQSGPLPSALEVLASLPPLPKIPQVPSAATLVNSASGRCFWMRTHTYESHRIRYARFCWGKGSEVWGYVHIAGGSCSTPVVQSRKQAVDRLIAAGAALPEVLSLLRSFDNAPAGRKKFVQVAAAET